MALPPKARWLALIAALLGWMLDGLEIGLFPLVGRTALRELLGDSASESTIGSWYAAINAGFLLGAATGGVFFGWLGDRLGRVRAMTLAVLVYAGCSGSCAIVQAPWQLAALRWAGSLGMGGEWALGVALVVELWPGTSRVWLAGAIGAFGNLGYVALACLALALNRLGDGQVHWRTLMLCGAAPAVLTLFLRLAVPESERWLAERRSGQATRWSCRDLLAVLAGSAVGAGLLATWILEVNWLVRAPVSILGIALIAACFLTPAIGYLKRTGAEVAEQRSTIGRMLLAAGLSSVPLLATWGGVLWVYNWVDQLAPDSPDARPLTQASTSIGAAIGALLAAHLAGWLGRRWSYAILCVLSAAALYGFYTLNTAFDAVFLIAAGFVGLITAGFYGWLPLYLPELFRTGVRATGQGFGFNFGRVFASFGSLQTGALLAAFDGSYARACSLAAGAYAFGLLLIPFAPETKGKPLPE